jgi:hypothetical protein
LAESLKRRLVALKAELGGDSPPPLERLLIERITASWLQVNYFDCLLAQAGGAGEARLRALQRQQDAAGRRHLAGIKQLALVRRLLRPAPAPVEIAARLGSQERVSADRRDLSPAQGVAVEN